jgi:hypothetical protein
MGFLHSGLHLLSEWSFQKPFSIEPKLKQRGFYGETRLERSGVSDNNYRADSGARQKNVIGGFSPGVSKPGVRPAKLLCQMREIRLSWWNLW